MKKLLMLILSVFLLVNFAFADNVSVLDLRQDDNHYFEITDNANNDLDLGADYTIEAWVYVKDAVHGNERIFRSQGWQMYVVSGTGSGGADANIRVDGTFLTAGGSITLTVPTEEWHHIAIQGNSAGWTNNYLDGAPDDNGGASNITGTLNLRIGSYSLASTDFIGCIDEVRISNGNRYSRWGFSVDKNTLPFTNDANTVLLYHFNDNATPPTNSSSKIFTIAHSGITTDDYLAYNDVSLSEELPLPITLSSFTAEALSGAVKLNWTTASETNNANFIIYRDGVALATIEGAGTSSESHAYSYIDNTVVPGVMYTYVLADVDYSNEETRYESHALRVKVETNEIDQKYILSSAYPNPFNPTTVLPLELKESAQVHVSLFDLNGKMLKEVLNSELNTGQYDIRVNLDNFSSGTYLVRVLVDNSVSVQKITFNK